VVRLIDHNDLEALLCAQIDLLCLRDFLEQVLHNYSVVVSDIRWCDFEVIDGCDNIEFEFPVRRSLEDACVDFDLFDSGAIEFFERRDDARFLACS
jgi:hypothetical protein